MSEKSDHLAFRCLMNQKNQIPKPVPIGEVDSPVINPSFSWQRVHVGQEPCALLILKREYEPFPLAAEPKSRIEFGFIAALIADAMEFALSLSESPISLFYS
jgi:hypothetical protein